MDKRIILMLLLFVIYPGCTEPEVWLESNFVNEDNRNYVNVMCSASLETGRLKSIRLLINGTVVIKYSKENDLRKSEDPRDKSQGAVQNKGAFLVLQRHNVALPFLETFNCGVEWGSTIPENMIRNLTVDIRGSDNSIAVEGSLGMTCLSEPARLGVGIVIGIATAMVAVVITGIIFYHFKRRVSVSYRPPMPLPSEAKVLSEYSHTGCDGYDSNEQYCDPSCNEFAVFEIAKDYCDSESRYFTIY